MSIPLDDFLLDLQDALNRGQITKEEYDVELKNHIDYLTGKIND